jgi:uncharacterized protein (TIGR00730 family)
MGNLARWKDTMASHDLDELIKQVGVDLSPSERRLAGDLLAAAVGFIGDKPALLDLKITAAAVAEMRDAFSHFAPYRDVPKVTIFGSARTSADDPLYRQAREVAHALADQGWMVVTGAGPGIMAAGAEGAGREHSFGVNIRLPFEQEANPFILGDPKLVSMKYFFTRKLMLMKESKAFISLPGGFGTIDETFELLTLTQTGKGVPAPIVFLDTPGDPFWESLHEFISTQLVDRHFIEAADLALYHITDSVQDAVAEVTNFYRNYHSIRFFGELLHVRLQHRPTVDQLGELNRSFDDICATGVISLSSAHREEIADNDHLHLSRLAFRFDKRHWSRLRALIDTVNGFPDVPTVTPIEP